ncbi:MAG: hypothetical protein ABGY96_03435 [bacterium]|nr:hypothetical protein [Pseudomonadales bacterium]
MTRLLLSLFIFFQATQVSATVIEELQQGWAIANYKIDSESQAQSFENLIKQADDAVAQNPEQADLLI